MEFYTKFQYVATGICFFPLNNLTYLLDTQVCLKLSTVLFLLITQKDSGIQPKGDTVSVEHSYALPDNRIQVENASESAVTENVGESTVTENGNVAMGQGSRERRMAILIINKMF